MTNKAAPVGTVNKTAKGFVIKLGNHQWRSYPKYMWEQAHNVKLGRNDRIIHMDGNKDNCALENLYLISPKHTTFVFMHIKYPTNAAEIDTLCAMADLHAEIRRKEIDVYGSSLGALKERIMGDPVRRAKKIEKDRQRANANRKKDPQAARDRNKDWYERNKDRVKQYHDKYRMENREKIREWNNQWRLEHQEQRRASQKRSYDKNKDKYNERKRQKYKEQKDGRTQV